MKSKKSRKSKTYAPVKSAERLLNRRADFVVIQCWESQQTDKPGLPEYTTNCSEDVLSRAVLYPRRWYFAAVVLCVDPNDTKWASYEERWEYISESPIYLNELKDRSSEWVDNVRKQVNHKHIVDIGWVARPFTPAFEAMLAEQEKYAEKIGF
ncbi:MAG: hypothetical protein OEX12_08855 [Gammaproteobacteria bacterium]|nr:hypothetical protein [Gammaproteobacteria bacterium]